MKTRCTIMLVLLGLLAGMPAWAKEVQFGKIIVDKTFRSEGVAVGDINHDGKMDIFAGDVWYSAPDWKMHEIRPVGQYDGSKSYSQCFANFAQDVDGDGWVDSIIIGYPGEPCRWYENPKNKPGHWKERQVVKSACNETPLFVDLLGKSRPVLIFGVRPEGLMAWFNIPKNLDGLWDMHIIAGPDAPGTKRYSHGLGCGDVNGDGRKDASGGSSSFLEATARNSNSMLSLISSLRRTRYDSLTSMVTALRIWSPESAILRTRATTPAATSRRCCTGLSFDVRRKAGSSSFHIKSTTIQVSEPNLRSWI